MDNDKFGRPVDSDQFEAEDASNDDDAGSWRAMSAESYERRSGIWARFKRGDWWIAIGFYLLFASVAFVVLG